MEQDKSIDVGQEEKGSFPGFKVLMLPVNILFHSGGEVDDGFSGEEEQRMSLLLSSSDEDNEIEDSASEKRKPSVNKAKSFPRALEYTTSEDEEKRNNKQEEEKDEGELTKKNSRLRRSKVSQENYKDADSTTTDTDEDTTTKRQDVTRIPRSPAKRLKGQNDYSCSKCSYISTNSYNLQLHKRIHTDERPYACSKCKVCFRTQSHLNRHTKHVDCTGAMQNNVEDGQPQNSWPRRRSGQVAKLLQCESCDYSTPESYNLKVHQRIHTNERPYRCDTCDATFRTTSHLYRHARTHQRPCHTKLQQKPPTCTVPCTPSFAKAKTSAVSQEMPTLRGKAKSSSTKNKSGPASEEEPTCGKKSKPPPGKHKTVPVLDERKTRHAKWRVSVSSPYVLKKKDMK